MRFKFSGFALAAILVGAVAAQTPTSDQLNALKNMPKDQQDALIQSVLGRGDGTGTGTGTKSDSRLDMPQTVQPKTDQSNELLNKLKKGKTLDDRTLRQPDEDPELRADDTVLIDLTPIDRYRDNNSNYPNGTNTSGTDTGTNGIGVGVNGVGADGSTANDGSVGGTRNGRNVRGNNNNDYGRVKADVKEQT